MKKYTKIFTNATLIVFFSLLLIASFGHIAFGQTTPAVNLPTGEAPPMINLENPLGGSTGEVSVPKIIGNVIKTILSIVGALALAMFIYGGFTWLTSGGSSEKITKGKDILIWATIGLAVIFSSYTLVDFLLKAFGL